MTEIKIKGCDDCPMVQYYPDQAERYCNITDTKIQASPIMGDGLMTPSNCPLKESPITIQLIEQ